MAQLHRPSSPSVNRRRLPLADRNQSARRPPLGHKVRADEGRDALIRQSSLYALEADMEELPPIHSPRSSRPPRALRSLSYFDLTPPPSSPVEQSPRVGGDRNVMWALASGSTDSSTTTKAAPTSSAEATLNVARNLIMLVAEDPVVACTVWAVLTLGLAYTTSNPVVSVLRRLLLFVAGVGPPLAAFAINFFGKVRSRFWAWKPVQDWIKPAPIELLEYVLKYATPNASSVCEEIDKFCWKVPMRNLGDAKAPIIDDLLRRRRPKKVVEFGSCLGYSSVRFGSILRDVPEARYVSVEPSAMGHAVQAKLLAYTGLTTTVDQVFATSADHLRKMAMNGEKIDVLILNHDEGQYMQDLVLALGLGLFQRGSIIIANNVMNPGCPKYKMFVLAHTQLFYTQVHETLVEYSTTAESEILVCEFIGK